MKRNDGTLVVEDARIIFRNFAGKEGMYNREGDKNFCLLLDEELSKQLEKDGWNVKFLKAREEGDEPQPYLEVTVNFRGPRPPQVVMITSRGRNILHEDEVEILDWADIQTVDLMIRPYEWSVNGKTGIKAYLQQLFATIEESPLELKYADIDDVPSRSGRTDDRDG